MGLRNGSWNYGAIAKTLHWIIAVLIIGLLIVGWTMEDAPATSKFMIYTMHKSFGILVLALVLCRIVWRVADPPPPPAPEIPKLMHIAASLGHFGLYVLMLAMPLSGWILNSAAGRPLNLFTIEGWSVPSLTTGLEGGPNPLLSGWMLDLYHLLGNPENAEPKLRDFAGMMHGLLAYAIVALILVHVVAALYHHFVRKDNTLARMVPFVKPPVR